MIHATLKLIYSEFKHILSCSLLLGSMVLNECGFRVQMNNGLCKGNQYFATKEHRNILHTSLFVSYCNEQYTDARFRE